jgi:hypothetical protein
MKKVSINGKKLNLNKKLISTLTPNEAAHIAGGAGTGRLITFNDLCDLKSNNTHIQSVCVCR